MEKNIKRTGRFAQGHLQVWIVTITSIVCVERCVDAERTHSPGLVARHSVSGVGSDIEQQVWGSFGGREQKGELLAGGARDPEH